MLSTVGWLVSTAVLALSLGHFAVTLPRQMQAPRGARFAIGVAMTPYVIAAWVILLTTIIPGAPKAVLAFGPGIVAAPYLAIVTSRLWKRIVVAGWRGMSGCAIRLLAAATGAVLLFALMQPVMFRIAQPVQGVDAAHYLNEAKTLTRTGNFRDFPGFAGAPDGSALASLHGASFAAYLTSAFAANALATGEIGPPRDMAIRVAFAVTFLLLFAAIYALAANVFEPWLTPPLTISIFLTTSFVSYTLVAASRDPFRLVPLLCLATLLVGQLRHGNIRRYPASTGVLFAFLAASTVNGHSLALVELPIVMTAWVLAFAGRLRKNVSTVIWGLAAVSVGALVGGSHYIATYLGTGTIMGDNAISGRAFAGTVYAKSMITTSDPRMGDDTSFFGLMGQILDRDWLQLVLGTALAAVLLLLLIHGWIWRRQRWIDGNRGVVFVSAATIGVALLYLLVGQMAGLNLTYSAAANFRYVYLWNLLASLVIGVTIARVLLPATPQRTTVNAARFPGPVA